MPECVQVDDWRLNGRLDDLRLYARGARDLTWSRGLVHALLEELHVNEEFDGLVAAVPRGRASEFPRLVAIALLLRHSWCPRDLDETAIRLRLVPVVPTVTPLTTRKSTTTRDREHRRRHGRRTARSEPRTRCR
jgi:hypothetical protein